QSETKQKSVKVIELKQQKDFSLELKIFRNEHGVWIVDSEYMRYWTNRIPLTTKDNILRYNQKMQTIGVEQKAKELGAKTGETINIYGNVLTID
ncbi:MAG: Obg family GTPase CgtA, partial [Mycoplasmataceae bacterium]|nr:Obg family GTPase CgtA [Mycoplasmataceae bacterium]